MKTDPVREEPERKNLYLVGSASICSPLTAPQLYYCSEQPLARGSRRKRPTAILQLVAGRSFQPASCSLTKSFLG